MNTVLEHVVEFTGPQQAAYDGRFERRAAMRMLKWVALALGGVTGWIYYVVNYGSVPGSFHFGW